jgi:hypothetical protein
VGKRGASYVGLVPFDLSQTGGIVVVSERCIVSSFGSPLLGVIMHYCSVLFWPCIDKDRVWKVMLNLMVIVSELIDMLRIRCQLIRELDI